MAGLVIPTPDYVRFVTHYGTRPDFCQGADPESKGIVEALVGYVKSDLMIPEELSVTDLKGANAKGAAWCNEVNAQVHSEIAAVPAERLVLERPLLGDLPSLRARIGKVAMRKVDRLSCVRFGSARYSVPTVHIGREVELRVADGTVMIVFLGEIIAEHAIVAPGETSVSDEHYGGARPAPNRAVRPKTPRRGGVRAPSVRWPRPSSKGAAARGVTTLAADLAELCAMEAAHGKDRAHRRPRAGGRVRPLPGPRRALHLGRRNRCATAPCARATPSSSTCPSSPPVPSSDYAIGGNQ